MPTDGSPRGPQTTAQFPATRPLEHLALAAQGFTTVGFTRDPLAPVKPLRRVATAAPRPEVLAEAALIAPKTPPPPPRPVNRIHAVRAESLPAPIAASSPSEPLPSRAVTEPIDNVALAALALSAAAPHHPPLPPRRAKPPTLPIVNGSPTTERYCTSSPSLEFMTDVPPPPPSPLPFRFPPLSPAKARRSPDPHLNRSFSLATEDNEREFHSDASARIPPPPPLDSPPSFPPRAGAVPSPRTLRWALGHEARREAMVHACPANTRPALAPPNSARSTPNSRSPRASPRRVGSERGSARLGQPFPHASPSPYGSTASLDFPAPPIILNGPWTDPMTVVRTTSSASRTPHLQRRSREIHVIEPASALLLGHSTPTLVPIVPEPLRAPSPPHRGATVCALMGCLFSWLPPIGWLTMFFHLRAPEGSNRRTYAMWAGAISTLVVFIGIFVAIFNGF